VQRPTSNVQRSTTEVAVAHSSSIPLGGLNTSGENLSQRFCFTNQRFDLGGREKRDAMNQTQPAPRFADFLQTNAELVDKVLARFGALQFTVVSERRSSTPQKLIGHVPACLSSRKCIG